MRNKIIYIAIFAILSASCKKQLDINNNPNDPVSVSVSTLLPTAELNLGLGLAIGSGLSQDLAVYTHQLTTREAPDQYGVTGGEFYLENAWNTLYKGTMANLEQIIKDGTENGNTRYSGIAKILKAYTYSQMVDVWGDIPYSEAQKLDSGIRYPKFDDDAGIYPSLFALIDEGINDLNNSSAENALVPGSDDVIYGGNVDKWVKAANTLKLKMYTQIRKVQDVTAEVNALISGGNLISTTSESFLLPFGPKGNTDDRNPGFGDYFATQRTNDISPWFYEILKGYNKNIFTGITDPRIPYYWYNQLSPTQAPREGNQTEYRDGAFVSIYFGSTGPHRDANQQNTITVLGIYPVGGRYDEGDAIAVTGESGTGAAPYRFITYADRLYLEAELIKEGLVPGDARSTLEAAMTESFKQVDYVISTYVKPAQTVPSLAGTDAVTEYISKVLAAYDANAAKQLEIIMTQKWISSFGSSVDQYTDYRRTGYPVLFDPNNPQMAPGGFVQPPINGDPMNPGAQEKVPVQQTRAYPLSLPWASSELETNPNAPPQKTDLSTSKIFWIP